MLTIQCFGLCPILTDLFDDLCILTSNTSHLTLIERSKVKSDMVVAFAIPMFLYAQHSMLWSTFNIYGDNSYFVKVNLK